MVAGVGTLTAAPPLAMAGTGGCPTVAMSATTVTGSATMPANPQGTVGTATTGGDVGPTRTRSGENRRSNKPIMEKRRRARINNCLNELKTLILDAMKKDPARHSKLEKADILEMTVKHLETLQRQQVAMAAATDPNVANKFRAGFTECAGEVGRFPGLEGPVKRRLLQHLANCLNNASPQQAAAPTPTNVPTEHPPAPHPVQVHILRTPDSNIIQGLQLVPTRLPNGDIALILPAARATPVSSSPSSPSPSVSSSSSGSSPLPMLIPIPNRTNGNSPSPVAFDRLSLVNTQSSRQVTTVTTPSPQPTPPSMSTPMLTNDSEDGRLVINEDYIDRSSPRMVNSPIKVDHDVNHRLVISDEYDPEDCKTHYNGETLLHIPEREYYDDSFDDSETEYYSQEIPRSYSPEMQAPLALVTRKRSEEREEQPWRPW